MSFLYFSHGRNFNHGFSTFATVSKWMHRIQLWFDEFNYFVIQVFVMHFFRMTSFVWQKRWKKRWKKRSFWAQVLSTCRYLLNLETHRFNRSSQVERMRWKFNHKIIEIRDDNRNIITKCLRKWNSNVSLALKA